jgi:Protein of unknown function (DUF3999)
LKTTIKSLIALVMFFSNVSANELVPDDFARALLIEANSGAAIYEVKIPANVYETVVRRDLGDMRVFNANEELVPHTLRKPKKTQIIETRISLPFFPLYDGNTKKSSANLDFTIADDGAIVRLREQGNTVLTENAQIKKYVIDSSKIGKKISALEFELLGAGDNYVKKLTIEQGSNLNKWQRLLNSATLTRLQYGDHQLQFNRVEIPYYREKYLRFSWHDATDGIQLGAVYAILKDSEQKNTVIWRNGKGDLVDSEQATYEFDSGGTFPIGQLNIELPDSNSLIEAKLYSRSDPNVDWVYRSSSLFYNLQVQGNRIQNDVISMPVVDDRYWQLKVNSDDGLGKNPLRFRFGWAGHSLFFLARGPGPFTLAFGSGKAEPTERPVATLLNVLNNKSQSNIVGNAYIRDSYELSGDAAKDKHFDISWQRTILWFVLAAGVFLLGFMAFRLLRQMNQAE